MVWASGWDFSHSTQGHQWWDILNKITFGFCRRREIYWLLVWLTFSSKALLRGVTQSIQCFRQKFGGRDTTDVERRILRVEMFILCYRYISSFLIPTKVAVLWIYLFIRTSNRPGYIWTLFSVTICGGDLPFVGPSLYFAVSTWYKYKNKSVTVNVRSTKL